RESQHRRRQRSAEAASDTLLFLSTTPNNRPKRSNHMNRNHVTIITALIFMLAGAVGAANAGTLPLHCKGAGTFPHGVGTHIETNGGGGAATLDQGLENCRSGGDNIRFFFQEEVEWIARPVSSACPAGTVEELFIDPTHGQQRVAVIDEKTGDQIFFKFTS